MAGAICELGRLASEPMVQGEAFALIYRRQGGWGQWGWGWGREGGAQACGKVTRPASSFSSQAAGVSQDVLTPVLVPPTVFHPHIALPTFHTYPSGSQPPCLPSCQPRCLALHPLPPSSDGACSGEPLEKCSCSWLPTRVGLGTELSPCHPSKLHSPEASRCEDRKMAQPPLPGSCILGGRAGDLSSESCGSGPCVCVPWGCPLWAGREPGGPMNPCSPDQPCGRGLL